jgi:hypothetical protein
MKLKELDWNAKGGVAEIEVEYPDDPIAALVNWLRRTSAWHEDVELVHRKVRHLDSRLAELRNARATEPSVADKRRAALAKARAAKAAKRLAAV